MNIVVQKYGGSSVASKEKLEIVIKKIAAAIDDGKKVVVVVSAQGKTTDELIQKAKEYTSGTYLKEMDMLLATGEMQTVALLTMMLKSYGYDAVGLTGGQAGIITDSNFSSAKIKTILKENILKYLDGGNIVVVAGFQGIDKFGNITTLGRGGSDLSAVAIAACLEASKCEIYTDVDGVYTADPNLIKEAKLINHISYDEMLEAASSGAKVLHNRAVNLAKKYNLKINVKNTRGDNMGTVVDENIDSINEEDNNKIIAVKKELAKLTVVGSQMYSNGDYLREIYTLASENNVKIYMISITEMALSIIVDEKNVDEFSKIIHEKLVKI